MKIDINKDQGKITAFLKEHQEFVNDFNGRDICLAGFGGSFSYGTNKDGNVFLDIDTRAFPIEDLSCFLNEINAVKHDYDNSSRNEKAIEHNKLSKHMMHLIRLYMTGIDLMHGELKTYRDGSDHELLMAIRCGEYLESDKKTPTEEFKKLLKDYQTKFDKAVEVSTILDEPDMNKVNALFMEMVKLSGII